MCLVPNPVLVPFLLIFDLCLLDIPPPLRGAPPHFGGLAFADKVICPEYLFVN